MGLDLGFRDGVGMGLGSDVSHQVRGSLHILCRVHVLFPHTSRSHRHRSKGNLTRGSSLRAYAARLNDPGPNLIQLFPLVS